MRFWPDRDVDVWISSCTFARGAVRHSPRTRSPLTVPLAALHDTCSRAFCCEHDVRMPRPCGLATSRCLKGPACGGRGAFSSTHMPLLASGLSEVSTLPHLTSLTPSPALVMLEFWPTTTPPWPRAPPALSARLLCWLLPAATSHHYGRAAAVEVVAPIEAGLIPPTLCSSATVDPKRVLVAEFSLCFS